MVSGRKPFIWSPDGRRWFVRRKGRYVRIKADFGTEAFDAEYWAIMRGRVAPRGSSWSELIASYRLSDRWTGLKPRTRKDYERVLIYVEEKNGRRDATRTRRADILAAMDANRHRTRFANYIPAVLSQLFEHAIDLGLMTANPAKGVRRLDVPEERRAAHLPWPDWAVDKWRAEARPEARLIFEIGVGSVQRPADWLRFCWRDYDGDSLRVTQGKTGVALVLPCTAALRAMLDAARPEDAAPETPILRGYRGRAMGYRSMADLMLDERKRLGLAAYDLHALRYRGIRELAFAGCTDDEIAAYSGHTTLAMIRKYAGEARQIMRARQARTKIEAANERGTIAERDTGDDTGDETHNDETR